MIKFSEDIFSDLELERVDLGIKERMLSICKFINGITDCIAIGIRIQKDGDYPYYAYEGFPKSFIIKENSLCVLDENGNRIRNGGGRFLLDCMCGAVINGNIDKKNPLFTHYGSFWTNSTTDILNGNGKIDFHTRNHCNLCGYESVALVPIKYQEGNIGLIQLNDKRRNKFTDDIIIEIENLSKKIAASIKTSILYDDFKSYIESLKKINIKMNKILK